MDSRDARLFSILALDGGGARGYLSAKLLENVESYLNAVTGQERPLGAHFDLIVGTSTGGIIALALALGRSAGDVARFYEDRLSIIFGTAMRRSRALLMFRPRYRAGGLDEALTDFFGDSKLADVKTDVCVTTVSLLNAKPRLFHSDYVRSGLSDDDERLADLARATASAPTYFATSAVPRLRHLVDGGLCANNPALVGVVESFRFSRPSRRAVIPPGHDGGACLDTITVLSVGTGEQCAMPYEPESLQAAGAAAWGTQFHNLAIESQSQLTHVLARGLLGRAYRRINPRLDFPMAMDDAKRAGALRNLAELSDDDLEFLRDHLGAPCSA
ncbi:MAG: CBASS cGAMP-activated phospholipase [Vulcanimicrobiaceae bacterium]